MVVAAVITAVGRVELKDVRGEFGDPCPPPYLRMFLSRPVEFIHDDSDLSTVPMDIVRLVRHRLVGFRLEYAYWPESWSDEWGLDELYLWEFGEARPKEQYNQRVVDEDILRSVDRIDAMLYGLNALEGMNNAVGSVSIPNEQSPRGIGGGDGER